MLECVNLSCGYDESAVLHNLNLSFSAGEITALTGTNGSGKSTLLRTLAGLLRPVEGSVLLDGRRLSEYKPRELAKRVAFLPQFHESPKIPVEVLVSHGRFPWQGFSRRSTPCDREIVGRAIERAGISSLRGRLVSSLSGGERQRCYIAMLLAQEADILLLDEPTASLDIHQQFELMALLTDLRNDGKTIVLSLHEIPLALQYSDRSAVLSEGGVPFVGTKAQMMHSRVPEEVFHVRILEANGHYLCAPL